MYQCTLSGVWCVYECALFSRRKDENLFYEIRKRYIWIKVQISHNPYAWCIIKWTNEGTLSGKREWK